MVSIKKEKYAEIARKMKAIAPEKCYSSHEWEELVQKMCTSDDVGLQDIGHKEHEFLNKNNSRCKEKQ